MSDQHQELLQKLEDLRLLVNAATLGPWRCEESKDTWTLHGEARNFKGTIRGGGTPGMQILKAPKRGTPYAEYWPNRADGELIVRAANMFPFWLDWAENVIARHYPIVCSCKDIHFLCAANRMYSWENCPEIEGLVRALDQLHIGEDHEHH